MKLIDRWSLMRCTQRENVQEHSLQVAMVAHSLAVIKNRFFGGQVNAERIALYGLFHDATEVLTGDLPTPVKYHNEVIRHAYKEIENHSTEQLLKLLPAGLTGDYRELLEGPTAGSPEYVLIKAADTLCAYMKCLEETSAGNSEFSRAKKTIEDKVRLMSEVPEIKYFVEHFIPSFSMTLDELSQPFETT